MQDYFIFLGGYRCSRVLGSGFRCQNLIEGLRNYSIADFALAQARARYLNRPRTRPRPSSSKIFQIVRHEPPILEDD